MSSFLSPDSPADTPRDFQGATPPYSVTVRPFRRLMWQGTVGVLMLCTPIFAAWLLATVPTNTWHPVPFVGAGVVLLCAAALVMFLRVSVTATPFEIRERTIWGSTNAVPLSNIARVVMLEMHRNMTSDSRLQLFVLDHTNNWVMRMRGEFWHRGDIETIADSIPMQIDRTSKPVTLAELQQESPSMLYWFERAPLRRK